MRAREGDQKKFSLKLPMDGFLLPPPALYHSFPIIIIIITFCSVISIFYLLNFTLSSNKTFQISLKNFSPYNSSFFPGTFPKHLLDVVGKASSLYPKSDTIAYISPMFFLLVPFLCYFCYLGFV